MHTDVLIIWEQLVWTLNKSLPTSFIYTCHILNTTAREVWMSKQKAEKKERTVGVFEASLQTYKWWKWQCDMSDMSSASTLNHIPSPSRIVRQWHGRDIVFFETTSTKLSNIIKGQDLQQHMNKPAWFAEVFRQLFFGSATSFLCYSIVTSYTTWSCIVLTTFVIEWQKFILKHIYHHKTLRNSISDLSNFNQT